MFTRLPRYKQPGIIFKEIKHINNQWITQIQPEAGTELTRPTINRRLAKRIFTMQIQLLLQTIILPLLLSFAVYKTAPKNTAWLTAGLFFAWLPASFWILQLPAWPPSEAVDWLWLAGLAFIAVQSIPNNLIKIYYIKLTQESNTY